MGVRTLHVSLQMPNSGQPLKPNVPSRRLQRSPMTELNQPGMVISISDHSKGWMGLRGSKSLLSGRARLSESTLVQPSAPSNIIFAHLPRYELHQKESLKHLTYPWIKGRHPIPWKSENREGSVACKEKRKSGIQIQSDRSTTTRSQAKVDMAIEMNG